MKSRTTLHHCQSSRVNRRLRNRRGKSTNVCGDIAGADLVIYDCMYTDEEYPRFKTWGHSTWQEGVRLCQAAHVKKLAIFHHDPDHEDPFMEQLERDARQTWDGAFVSRETMLVQLK